MTTAAAVLFWALLWFGLGPLVPVLSVLALTVPRVRRRVWPWLRPTRRTLGGVAAGVVLVAGLVWVVPDGRLPIPTGSGAWVTPGYTGRPIETKPIDLKIPQNEAMAPNGRSSMHEDAWASDAHPGPGPTGLSPQVDSAWYGVEECATLAFDSQGRMVGLCGTRSGPQLRVIDPESMRPLATKNLPDRPDSDKPPWADLCAGAYFYLDADDHAVVATTDRRILTVSTSDGSGDPDLATLDETDLSAVMPADDCLLAVLPDSAGRTWFVTQGGRIGYVTDGGRPRVLDLGEEVANSISSDADGGVYAVTVDALYRLHAGGSGPVVDWRTPYERGSGVKPGQLSQGAGTTPTLMPGGLIAITDNANPRMHVIVLRTGDGSEVCQTEVFDDDASATENSLVLVGPTGLVVENNEGYSSPLRTLLGRRPAGGLARVDVRDGRCSLTWTSPEVAPSSVAKLSLATGLLYAYTKRKSWLGVDAWYLTAIDPTTGRTAWSVRTGRGPLYNNHYSAITLGPDGSAYVATLAGLVRVRDRRQSG
ncbi:hypothetical protein ISG29_05895 [Nocardioides sp. CBS4Y-1]|uniref:Uncharacterized protein n=1 Tax=Nocardioides acrostichi TaxID=2784339 RepID=A0A930UWZ4_9ACTN|nr:hypothetical protein [Nocardioides acrostichi]